MKKISLIHIDDNPFDLEHFQSVCQMLDSGPEWQGFTDIPQALAAIEEMPPDIIVLDIEMGGENGFRLARQLAEGPSLIVFLTSHAGYALQAFSLFALHFIVKPARPADLEQVLERYRRLQPGWWAGQTQVNQVNQLVSQINQPAEPLRRLFIHQFNGVSIVQISDLVYLEAESAYTRFHLADGRKILSSDTLKTYDELLRNHPDLVRVHRSYMVNKNFVREVKHDKYQWMAWLTTGEKIEVSRLKKDQVMLELAR